MNGGKRGGGEEDPRIGGGETEWSEICRTGIEPSESVSVSESVPSEVMILRQVVGCCCCCCSDCCCEDDDGGKEMA